MVQWHRGEQPTVHDTPRVHVGHEGHVQPGADAGEVRDTELVRPLDCATRNRDALAVHRFQTLRPHPDARYDGRFNLCVSVWG